MPEDDFVAQLVEQMTLNHWVEGSSPSEVTKKRLPSEYFSDGSRFSLMTDKKNPAVRAGFFRYGVDGGRLHTWRSGRHGPYALLLREK